jgi:alkaline phosphatase D
MRHGVKTTRGRSSVGATALIGTLLLQAALTPPALGAGASFTSGVASGDVTPSSAILWTRAVTEVSDAKIKVEVWKDGECLTDKKAFKADATPHAASDFTVKVDAIGLEPSTAYCYRFRGGAEAFSPVGRFETAPAPEQPASVHFTYNGDMDGTRVGGVPVFGDFEILDSMRAEAGDFSVLLGDTIYSDSGHRPTGPATTLAEYRAAYRENRSIQALPDYLASTSLYAQLDDHEVHNDFDGQTVDPARYAAGRQAFLEYMPIRESFLSDPSCAGDPLYRKFSWGSEIDIFVPDERSCRSGDVAVNPCLGDLAPTLPAPLRQAPPFNQFLSPNPPAGCLEAIFDPTRTVLGPVQKQMLKNDLLNSTATVKYVLNEYPILQYHALPYDRWEGYGAERNELLDFIRSNGISNVVFLTTDHHATIQNQVSVDRFLDDGPIAHEFVTGPVATDTLQQEVLDVVGPAGLQAFQGLLTLNGVDCRHLDQFSYGDVTYDSSSDTTTVASLDVDGGPIQDQLSAASCSATVP